MPIVEGTKSKQKTKGVIHGSLPKQTVEMWVPVYKPKQRSRVGKRIHSVTITDKQILQATKEWMKDCTSTDNPPEGQEIAMRHALEMVVGRSLEMVSITWLRNEMVAFRKLKKLKQAKHRIEK